MDRLLHLLCRRKLAAMDKRSQPSDSATLRPVPFDNVGNSCYINSTLQALLCVDNVRSVLEQDRFSTEALAIVLHNAYYPSAASIVPSSYVMDKEMYNGFQEDAHVFYLRMVEGMQVDLQAALFRGEMASVFTCSSCADVTVSNVENFVSLSLPILGEDGVPIASIRSALTHYLKGESGVTKTCRSCHCAGMTTAFSKKIQILKGPDVLVVQLKRWLSDGTLLDHHVSVDEVLRLDDQEYRLQSVVHHKGVSPAYGHYIAFTSCDGPASATRQWRCYDDSDVMVWHGRVDDGRS